MDFIALDVETANADMASICAIGLVQFKDGRAFRNLGSLIDPEDHFDPINVSIHGIRPEHVKGKPTMRALYPALQAHLTGNIVVVHHTHFDKTALRKVGERFGQPDLTCQWLDSCRIARSAWPQYKGNGGYGLTALAGVFGIEFEHHRADEDARCAGMVVCRAINDTGIDIQGWFERLAAKKKSSGRVTLDPINEDGPLAGEVVTFTGQLSIDRAQAANLAALAGAQVTGGVTKQTTMLIIGEQDARLLAGYDKSSKHRKAEDCIRAGQNIRIVTEAGLSAMLATALD